MFRNTLFPVTNTFDDIFEEFSTKVYNTETGYPRTNIYTDEDENAFLSLAVTGIPEDKIQVYIDDDDYLTVEANIGTDNRNYQLKGYPVKSFQKKFWIDKKYEIGQAIVENGELIIRLNRTTPKRREIPIISPVDTITEDVA
jgi:HSP20 family molecular chaperone IbpA